MNKLLYIAIGFGLNVLANDKELRTKVFNEVKKGMQQLDKELKGGKK